MLVGDEIFCSIFCSIFLISNFYYPFSSSSFWKPGGYSGCILRLRIAFDGLRFLGGKEHTWVGVAPRHDGSKLDLEKRKRQRRWLQS